MAIPSSGPLQLRGDIALEVDGSATGTDVSLRALSASAGFTEPDTMSEFYGYSSISAPSVTTNAATSVTASSMTLNGNATADNGASITDRGFYFGTDSNYANNTKTSVGGTGTGTFTLSRTGLNPNTTYYATAYATNSVGEGRGSTVSQSTANVTAPTVTYNSQSSTYTTITLNYTVNWGGHSSGTYKLETEIYSSASLGTTFYETVVNQTNSGSAPSGNQTISFTITPPSQYADNDANYRLKVKATNQVGTTTDSGNSGGYRSASVQAATQYTWRSADQNSYRGWKFESNYVSFNTSNLLSGSFMRDQVNHPQLGWYTTHQTNHNAGGSNFTGNVYVPDLNYNTSYAYLTTVADKTGSTNGVYHRNAYPSSVSAGSRPNRRTLINWKMSNITIYGGAVNTFGFKHSNHSMTAVGTDYNNHSATLVTSPSALSNPNGYYGWSGTTTSYNGTQHAIWENTGASNVSGDFQIQVTYS